MWKGAPGILAAPSEEGPAAAPPGALLVFLPGGPFQALHPLVRSGGAPGLRLSQGRAEKGSHLPSFPVSWSQLQQAPPANASRPGGEQCEAQGPVLEAQGHRQSRPSQAL